MGCTSSSSLPVEEPAELKQPTEVTQIVTVVEESRDTLSISLGSVNDGSSALNATLRRECYSKTSSNTLSFSPYGSKNSVLSSTSNNDPSTRVTSLDYDLDKIPDVEDEGVITEYENINNNEFNIIKPTGIAIKTDDEKKESNREYGMLTAPNIEKMKSCSRLQDDLDRANSKANFKPGVGGASDSSMSSSLRNDLSGFHNNEHGVLRKNYSDKSTFSREDSGLSSLYHSEYSDKSKFSMESGHASSISGMSNMSPIILSRNDDRVLEATQELHHESDCDRSSTNEHYPDTHMETDDSDEVSDDDDDDGSKDKVSSENGEVDEWKDYLRKLSTDKSSPNDDDGSVSESSDEENDDVVHEDDVEEIEGYFLYITAEGHRVWILKNEERNKDDYNDEEVNELISSNNSSSSDPGDDSFSPFHLSKEDMLSNVSRVREFRNKKKYENALVEQREEQARKLETIRQTSTTSSDGNEGLSIAERKKLLWNNDGKLEAPSKI